MTGPGLVSAHSLAEGTRRPAGFLRGVLLDGATVYPANGSTPLAGPAPESLREHHSRFGGRPDFGAGSRSGLLLDALDQIELAGRGGAHFPVAAKWRTALDAGGGGTVVANAAEGEPASAKDAALLRHRPHLVLDGLAIAAEALGAERAVVWLHRSAAATLRALDAALAERRTERRPERRPDRLIELVTGPDSYLSGESSAVVRALDGGPALPAFRREPAARSGVGGLPTVVHNVETLARVALAARTGAAGYRDSTLLTVLVGGVRVVLEVDPQTTLAAAVWHAGGLVPRRSDRQGPARLADRAQAVLIGGYGGTWMRWDQAADLPLRHAALRRAGAGLGAGVLAPLPTRACGLAETATVLGYLADSGAQQCGPCRSGLPAVHDRFLDLARGRGGPAGLRRLRRYLDEVDGRGGCHLPDGAARLARSALHTFERDTAEHACRGRCLHPAARPVLPVPRARG